MSNFCNSQSFSNSKVFIYLVDLQHRNQMDLMTDIPDSRTDVVKLSYSARLQDCSAQHTLIVRTI